MKSKMKIKVVEGVCCMSMILSVLSCAKGADDKELFSGGVTNTQLESPESVSFSTLANSDGSESLKLSWPVVVGAGGYKVNVYNVNDSENPLGVVTDSIIDGCTMSFLKMEDTNYRISVQTEGNEKLNNTAAKTSTELDYKAFVAVATLHEGGNIAAYVNNEMQDFTQDQEQCVNLVAGKTYNLDEVADFGLNTVTFRGDQNNPPTIVVGASGGLVTGGGLKVKYINFDCSAMATQVGVITLGDGAALGAPATPVGGACLIDNTISFQGCNFNGIKNSLIFAGTGSKGWAVKDLRVMNCIVQIDNGTNDSPVINFFKSGGRAIKSLTILNNTFYNLKTNNKAYFIRMNNASNAKPEKSWNDKTGSVTITNNTFCQTFSNKDFANNMASTGDVTTTMKSNIFYNTFRVQKIVGNTVKAISDNYLFSTGGENIGALDNTDKTYGTEEDPQFTGPIDQAPKLVNFAPSKNTKAYANKAGDPRWIK